MITHKDIVAYSADASFLFKSHTKNILTTFLTITARDKFSGEFTKFLSGQEISKLKYFNTKNDMLNEGTSLVGWYQEFVTDKVVSYKTFPEEIVGCC